MGAVNRQVRGHTNGPHFLTGEVEHLRSDSDEGPRKFDVAAEVFEQEVRVTVERIWTMRTFD